MYDFYPFPSKRHLYLSPAIIQSHVERRLLTGLQFDVQRKIKQIWGESH